MRTATRALRKLIAAPHKPIAPSQPSCSRWLTCTCCRPATYFSPNGSKALPKRIPPPSAAPPADDPNPISKAHFLPLPPRLPYSPTSHPFKRHLEILSLSTISSSPEESWRIYLSLHPSLRRYIPDDLFRSLLSHQLSATPPRQRWVRSRALIQFGQSCGMTIDTLGAEIVQNALQAGLIYAVDVKKSTAGMERIIEGLWAALLRVRKGNMSMLDLQTLKRWLRFHLLGVEAWQERVREHPSQAFTHRTPSEVVMEVVAAGAYGVADELLDALLSAEVGRGSKEALEAAIYCWRRGIDISDSTVQTLMWRVREEGGDLAQVLQDASAGVAETVRDRVETVLARIATLADRAVSLLAQPPPYHPAPLVDIGLQLLRNDNDLTEYELVLSLCQRLQSIRNAEAEPLYHAFADKLLAASQLPSPPIPIIIRFAQILTSASSDPTYPQTILLSFLHLDSPLAYPGARAVYPIARSAGFRWTQETREMGRRLLNQAIAPDTRHLHFASRIYADLIADKHRPSRRDMLAMIRAIGMSHNDSRPILLERHLRDFVGFFPDSRSDLVREMVSGLVYNQNPGDGLLAWTLVKRLGCESEAIPAKSIMACLSTSGRAKHREAMFEILAAQSSQTDTLPQLYDIVLTSIIHCAHSDPRHSLSFDEALTQAGVLLREMAAKGIPPSIKVTTALVRGLVEANQLDMAITVLGTAGRAGIRVKSSSVGRLMVRLATKERYDDAEEVERMWRASLGAKHVYDRGVVGARAMMDVKRGRKVDLEELRQRTGWVGNKPFLAYMRSLAPKEVKNEEEAVVQEGEAAVGSEVEEMAGQEGPVKAKEERRASASRSVSEDGVRLGYGGFSMAGVGCIAV